MDNIYLPTNVCNYNDTLPSGEWKLFDIDESQQNLTDDTPVFDNTKVNERFKEFKL